MCLYGWYNQSFGCVKEVRSHPRAKTTKSLEEGKGQGGGAGGDSGALRHQLQTMLDQVLTGCAYVEFGGRIVYHSILYIYRLVTEHRLSTLIGS